MMMATGNGSVRLPSATPLGCPSNMHYLAPSNIKKYQAKENAHTEQQPGQRVLQAALITGDMAMRNVALRINLK